MYEWNMQDLWDKRPNLWIMGMEGDIYAKGIQNIFQYNHSRNFLSLGKERLIHVLRDTQNTKQTGPEKKSPCHIIVCIQSKECGLRATGEKHQLTY